LERHLARVVGQHHRRGLGDRTQLPVGGMSQDVRHGRYPTSTTSSTSTGASSGSSATPTAERACTPASPNTPASRSEAPLTTPGWALNPGAEATNPTTLTTLTTESMPTRASTA